MECLDSDTIAPPATWVIRASSDDVALAGRENEQHDR